MTFLLATFRSVRVIVLAAACGVLVAGCSSRPPEPPAEKWDVLLITLDTARADRFFGAVRAPVAGDPDRTGSLTPRIDTLAARGASFSNAISPVPLTLPAHASILTGRQPPSHTVRDNGSFRLPETETTLAEILADRGYSTAAFIGAEVLHSRYGLDQGFATYDEDIADPGSDPVLYYPERRGEDVADAALEWLKNQDEGPVFTWVHLFDPHAPYDPPEPERSRHESAYDAEIAYVDRVVGKIIDTWQQIRGLDRLVVVLTADHGESLGELGEATHGVLVHDAVLRVPLMFRGPDLSNARSIGEPVHLIDVMPTVLSWLGIERPEGVQGRDLTPLIRGESVEWEPVAGYSESLYAQLHHGCAPFRAYRDGRWKLIHGVADELYYLVEDPGELGDIADSRPDRVEEMGGILEELVLELEVGGGERVVLDEEARQALEALGYVWSSPSSPSGAPRDPREALVSLSKMAEADRLAAKGDGHGAVALYREVIQAEPTSADPRVRLAQVYLAGRRTDEALELLADAVAVAPHEPLVHQKHGDTLSRAGRMQEALVAYETGLARHPEARGLRDGRWRCLYQLGRAEVVLAEADRVIAQDPRDGMARFARALSCCGDDLDAYLAELERAVAEVPDDPVLAIALERARAEAAARP